MKSLEKHGDIIFGLLACACSLFVLTMPYLDPLNISGFPALDWMAAPILWVFFLSCAVGCRNRPYTDFWWVWVSAPLAFLNWLIVLMIVPIFGF